MISFSLLLLSLALAMDAFAAAVAQGASHRPDRSTALRTSLAFGLAQGIMPLFGWGLGAMSGEFIQALDHWIALMLLGFLGQRMIRDGLNDDPDTAIRDITIWPLVVAAVATSIDAAVAGVTLPSFGVPIAAACIVIGLTTAVLTFPGVYLGAMAGRKLGKWAEVLGGLILIGLGVRIFIEHQF